MEIREVDLGTIKPLINEFYTKDPNLLKTWHVKAPTSLEDAVADTVSRFLDSPKISYYLVSCNGRLIGYFAVEETDLRYVKGFFLDVESRTHKYKEMFLAALKITLGEVIIPLNAINLRARRFLENNGYDILIENAEYVVLYCDE